MSPLEDVARAATAAALRVRTRLRRRLDEPLDPYAVAEELGLSVRFEPIPSLEGMYFPARQLIVIGSLRPLGRRAFTCAHELGHHELGHGLRVDDVLEGLDSEHDPARPLEEYAADRFAAALLMPKMAVERVFASRGWAIATCSPGELYVAAGVLGVGYTTLIGYLERTLRLLPSHRARDLRRQRLPRLREQLAAGCDAGVVVVDEHWSGRDVDIEVGDTALLPAGATVDGACIEVTASPLSVRARAVSPGVAEARTRRWRSSIRVARTGYRGANRYRHLEDPDEPALR